MKKVLLTIAAVLVSIGICFAVSVKPIVNFRPALEVKTFPAVNKDVDGGRVYHADGWYETDQDIFNRYFAEPQLIDLGLNIKSDHVNLLFDIDARNNIVNYATSEKFSFTNLPFIGNALGAVTDLTFPRLGFVEFDLGELFASVGRRKLKWGPGTYDFAIGDTAPFFDSIWLDYGVDTKEGRFSFNYAIVGFPSGTFADGVSKRMVAHKLAWRNEFLKVGIGELNMLYGKTSPTLFDYSPLAIYHDNYEDHMSNVMLDFDIEGLIDTKNDVGTKIRLWGLFAMDDFDLPAEKTKTMDIKPAAMGFGAGLEIHVMDTPEFEGNKMDYSDWAIREDSFDFNNGLNISLEGYYASTYLYNRTCNEGKFTVPHRMFAEFGYVSNSNATYIGFKYGPNSLLFRFNAEYGQARWNAHLTGELLIRGMFGIDTPYGDNNKAFSEENRETVFANCFKLGKISTRTLKLEAGAEYNITKNFIAQFKGSMDMDMINKKNALYAYLGVSYSLNPSL